MTTAAALPTPLLTAISAAGGGKVALVIGAGCSIEEPTGIPGGEQASLQCHRRLVANGVLDENDCPDPKNLSCLADTVFRKTEKQDALVDALSSSYDYRTATPNEGHKLAAALLGERAIAFVVTLNFDLALSTAVSELGVGEVVGIIDGPEALPRQKAVNVYYLHRNVDAGPGDWVLRTDAIKAGWTGTWQPIITTRVLTTPVVVFAGLGSPADVLVETVTLIREAIPGASTTYLIEPGDLTKSEFFKALGLETTAVIPTGWCDFMALLSQRVLIEQTDLLLMQAAAITKRESLHDEDVSQMIGRLKQLGLLTLGGIRAQWCLHDKPYCPDNEYARESIADLLVATAMIERVSGATAVLCADAVVEFRRDDRTVCAYSLMSGRGSRGASVMEAEVSARQRQLRGRSVPVSGAIVASVADHDPVVSPPRDVVRGDESGSILSGVPATTLFNVGSMRRDPSVIAMVVP